MTLLLLFINYTASAGPGDDIWQNITTINALLAVMREDITSLQQESTSTTIAVSQLQTGLKHLSEVIQALSSDSNQSLATMSNEVANVKSALPKPHVIGEYYHGGIVFYVDESGQHGLIASKIDCNEEGIEWRNGLSGSKITNARGDGLGAGETNTLLIISQQTIDKQKGSFAALLAHNFKVSEDGITPCKTPVTPDARCYGAWYLPSSFELQLIHLNLHQAGFASFVPEFYWSSTEINVANAWLVNFATGETIASNKSNTIGHVRAVSRF